MCWAKPGSIGDVGSGLVRGAPRSPRRRAKAPPPGRGRRSGPTRPHGRSVQSHLTATAIAQGRGSSWNRRMCTAANLCVPISRISPFPRGASASGGTEPNTGHRPSSAFPVSDGSVIRFPIRIIVRSRRRRCVRGETDSMSSSHLSDRAAVIQAVYRRPRHSHAWLAVRLPLRRSTREMGQPHWS